VAVAVLAFAILIFPASKDALFFRSDPGSRAPNAARI
jgi:hypothetical protein